MSTPPNDARSDTTRSDTSRSALVVGGGSWGTALANLLARRGVETSIWARETEVVDAINTERENGAFLPGVILDPNLRATSDLPRAVAETSLLVSAVPTQHVRSVWSEIADVAPAESLIVSVSKGIEIDTLRTPSAILNEVLAGHAAPRLVVLSGPSFAREVAAEYPTAVVAASSDEAASHDVQRLFSSGSFRVYTTDDVIGVELGGAVKNVIAIAAGIVEGLRYGHNTTAALITRGLAEISRLGVAMGADPFTFAGLSGMGDLVLTCTGGLSRNRTVGVELGRGRTIDAITADMNMVAEGVKTTMAVRQLSESANVEMPICDQMYEVLYQGKSPILAVRDLMSRELRPERE